MKTATIPPLRVEPALRKAAVSVLREGETLSAFVEQAVRSSVEARTLQREFIASGLAAEQAAIRDDSWISAADALTHLRSRGAPKRKPGGPAPRRSR